MNQVVTTRYLSSILPQKWMKDLDRSLEFKKGSIEIPMSFLSYWSKEEKFVLSHITKFSSKVETLY